MTPEVRVRTRKPLEPTIAPETVRVRERAPRPEAKPAVDPSMVRVRKRAREPHTPPAPCNFLFMPGAITNLQQSKASKAAGETGFIQLALKGVGQDVRRRSHYLFAGRPELDRFMDWWDGPHNRRPVTIEMIRLAVEGTPVVVRTRTRNPS